MKKLTILCAAVVFIAMVSSCKKDQRTVTLGAVIEQNQKLYIDDHHPSWMTGDQVYVNTASYTLADISGGSADIYGVLAADAYRAIFPAGLVSENSDISGTPQVAVTLPSITEYNVVDGHQRCDLPMGAYTDGNTLQFRNLCSVLRVTVNNQTSSAIDIKGITISATDAYLSGVGTAIITGQTGDSIVMNSGSHNVTLAKSDNTTMETLAATGSHAFDIVAPAFTSSDVTITVTTATGYKTRTITGASLLNSTVTTVTVNVDELTEPEYLTLPDSIASYYLNANGLMGAALKTALGNIVKVMDTLTYNEIWGAFFYTDLRSDGKIWDMYSNITNYDPVTSGSNYRVEGDCYNREHSFPNSWFGGKNKFPMYTDLHHVCPTDGYVNNRRANYAFGEVDDSIKYQSANGFSKLGYGHVLGRSVLVFEPNDIYKGDFARAYFYMVTCYEDKLQNWYTNYGTKDGINVTLDGSTYPGFTSWQLSMLLRWAAEDPVSEKETNRNNAIYGQQHNRNPFVDYPGLERYVWGDRTEKAFSNSHYEM